MKEKILAFLWGMGSVLDLSGSPRIPVDQNITLGTPEDDAAKMRGDWQNVGNSIRAAMDVIDSETRAL
jgi:chromosome condensin MukBEF complex kleisin-like MukF subunit